MSELPNQPTQYGGGSGTIRSCLVAEEKYHRRIFLLQFVRDVNRNHCFSSSRATRYPKEIASTLLPLPVGIVACNPLASARSSVALVRDEIVSIDAWITEEQSISTFLWPYMT